MFERLQANATRVRPPRQVTFGYGPWYGGLLTERRAEQAKPSECSELLNFVMTEEGIARTRNGTSLVSSGASGEIKFVRDVKVGSTWYTIYTDSNNVLYYDVSGSATSIATLLGEAHFVGFMGLLLLFDGGNVKFWNGTAIDIAYDNGTGTTTPYQHNNRLGSDDTFLALGNATNTRVANKFTTQTWDTGYTIPPTTFFVWLEKVGNGYTGTDNVAITAYIRRVDTDAEVASKTLSATAGAIAASATEYDITFTSDDITSELAPATEYYLSVEYDNGDATNYIKVHCSDNDDGAGVSLVYTGGAWAADGDKDCLMALKPGMTPKLVFGVVHKDRIFGIEGIDGTNPGQIWYCAAGNHLDWSTSNGGGNVKVIDSSATNYPVGGLVSWYQRLWVFGTTRQPFLGELSGDTPSDYVVNDTLQMVSGHYKSIRAIPSDVMFFQKTGVISMKTIQEYGDIRTSTQTDSIRHTIHRYFTESAIGGYDPEWGLYLLKLPDFDKTIVVHTNIKAARRKGVVEQSFSPVSLWDFAFSGEPTAFGDGNGFALIGTDDGKVYKMDNTVVQDDDNDVTYSLKSHYLLTRFGETAAHKVSSGAFSSVGCTYDINFYRNHERVKHDGVTITVPWDPTIPAEDLTMDYDEMDFLVEAEDFINRDELNFNFRSLMIGIEDISLNGRPVYFGPIMISADSIGGF